MEGGGKYVYVFRRREGTSKGVLYRLDTISVFSPSVSPESSVEYKYIYIYIYLLVVIIVKKKKTSNQQVGEKRVGGAFFFFASFSLRCRTAAPFPWYSRVYTDTQDVSVDFLLLDNTFPVVVICLQSQGRRGGWTSLRALVVSFCLHIPFLPM